MGLFDRLSGRRKSEDALAQARAEAGDEGVDIAPIAAPVTTDSGEVIGKPIQQAGFGTEGVEIPGMENLGALGPMIQQAIASGNAQVINQPEMSVYMENAQSARKAVLEVLAKHGIDAEPGSGQQISITNPNMAQEIFQALSQSGAFDATALEQGEQPRTEPTPGA
jgi:hypothetical protein